MVAAIAWALVTFANLLLLLPLRLRFVLRFCPVRQRIRRKLLLA